MLKIAKDSGTVGKPCQLQNFLWLLLLQGAGSIED